MKDRAKRNSHNIEARPLAWRGREVLRILYWCGLTNVVIVAAIAWGVGIAGIEPIADRLSEQRADGRGDLPPFVFVTVAPGERKMTLPVTYAALSYRAQPETAAEDAGETEMSREAVSFAAPEAIEGLEASSMAPVLQLNRQNGALEIGSFKSMSFPGGAAECVAIGRSMLEDTGSTSGKLEVLAASGPIEAARICAANGSVIISCRGGQITVSPRRARPDDKCERFG